MSRPLIIEKDRFRLIYSDGYIAIDIDGSGRLSIQLDSEQMIQLSRALWYDSKQCERG